MESLSPPQNAPHISRSRGNCWRLGKTHLPRHSNGEIPNGSKLSPSGQSWPNRSRSNGASERMHHTRSDSRISAIMTSKGVHSACNSAHLLPSKLVLGVVNMQLLLAHPLARRFIGIIVRDGFNPPNYYAPVSGIDKLQTLRRPIISSSIPKRYTPRTIRMDEICQAPKERERKEEKREGKKIPIWNIQNWS
jgi:hypothetical protein